MQWKYTMEDQPVNRARMLKGVEDKEGLLCTITDRIDKEVLERAPCLKVIANNGVGYDHIDIEAATARRIPVTNTPGVLTDDTADLTFALILASARRIVEGDRTTGKENSSAGRLGLPGLEGERKDPGNRGLRSNRAGSGKRARIRYEDRLSQQDPPRAVAGKGSECLLHAA